MLKDKHIFIIEDNLANRAVMLTMLQREGAKTSFDQWGTNAVERMRGAGKIDLILMDLMLPRGLTGYDIFDQIKSTELAGIPVVIVSASDANVEMKKARQLGFSGYIGKPINPKTFAAHIANVLAGQEVWADDIYG
jgi:CheY-like chemotaxis protein